MNVCSLSHVLSVSDAVIMTVVARVHSVHLINVKQHQVAADNQTKPTNLGC